MIFFTVFLYHKFFGYRLSKTGRRGDILNFIRIYTYTHVVYMDNGRLYTAEGFNYWSTRCRFTCGSVCDEQATVTLYTQPNKMHFLYVFILQFPYNSTCFERTFLSSSGVHDLLYSAALYKPYKPCKALHGLYGLYRAAEYSKS